MEDPENAFAWLHSLQSERFGPFGRSCDTFWQNSSGMNNVLSMRRQRAMNCDSRTPLFFRLRNYIQGYHYGPLYGKSTIFCDKVYRSLAKRPSNFPHHSCPNTGSTNTNHNLQGKPNNHDGGQNPPKGCHYLPCSPCYSQSTSQKMTARPLHFAKTWHRSRLFVGAFLGIFHYYDQTHSKLVPGP